MDLRVMRTAFAPNDKWLQRLKEKLEHEWHRDSAAHVVRGVHSVCRCVYVFVCVCMFMCV